MDLGGRPAVSLREILEEDYGIKLFYDSFDGTSLYATGEFRKTILLNRDHGRCHSNLNLVCELFQLLIQDVGFEDDHQEQSAQIFALALLMPSSSLMEMMGVRAPRGKLPISDLVAMAQGSAFLPKHSFGDCATCAESLETTWKLY